MTSRSDVFNLMKQMNIDPSLFNEEELRLFEQGGVALTDSDGDESLRDSFVSLGPQQDKNIKPSGQTYQQQQQNNQITAETIELRYQAVVQGLNGRIKILEQEINRQKIQYENEKRNTIQENKRENEILQNELRQLRTRHVHVEGQIPLIKEALSKVRDMLTGLVPENVYLRLRDIPERDLPPSEWILVNVWEMVYPFKKESELQKKEIFRMREELKQQIDKNNQILGELEHANRLLYDKDDDYKRHQLNYENARKSLEQELTKAHEELEILREKGSSYDELMRKFKQVEQEKFLLEEKIGFYDGEQGKEGKHVLSEIYKTSDDMRRKNELLTQDKEYLTKENIQLLEKNKRLDDRVDKLETELIEAKNQAQSYLFKLLDHKTETIADYEKRVNKEINELREKQQFELRTSKENIIEIYEKQIRFLKDAKEEIEIKLDMSEQMSREKDRAYNNLMVENRTLQKQVNSDLAEMRISLRIKSEEYERLQNTFEEVNTNLKATRQENEMLRDKLQVLKGEYYKAEGQTKTDTATLKAENAVLQERLRDYESMEKEIDEAVEGLAASNDNSDPNNPYLMTINNAPTSTRRRVKQAMNLAQRLQQKQKEAEKLTQLLTTKREETEQLKSRIKIAEDLLSKTNQPYSMLLGQIEEKEKEILKYNNTLKKERQDYDNLKSEYEQMKQQFDRVSQDVKNLLIRRGNIMNIQNLLLKLVQSDASQIKNNVKSLIDEITDILQNKQAVQGQPLIQGNTAKKNYADNDQSNIAENQKPNWYNNLNSKLKK